MARIRFIAAASVLALMAACGQTTTTEATAPPVAETPAPLAMAAADFAQLAANSDAFEIQASQLAATHASHQQVKDFAAMMVRDHTATTQELTTLAAANNLPTPMANIDPAHQQILDQLRGLNGEQFDDAYIDQQVQAHQQAVAAFQTFAQSGEAGAVRDWAQLTLPKLQSHLTSAQTLDSAT